MSMATPRVEQLREHLGGIAEHTDRHGLSGFLRLERPGDGVVQVFGPLIEVAGFESALDAGRVDLHAQRHPVVHGDGERLGTAHAAEPGGQGERVAQRAAVRLLGNGEERLIGALQDALGPDVDPGPGRHLAVHHEPFGFQLPERLPVGPIGHQQTVGDEHPGRHLVGPEHADRLAGLDEEGLVVLEIGERPDDGVIGVPVSGCLAAPAVHHQLVGILGHRRVEVVHEAAQRRFLQPPFGREPGPSRGMNGFHRILLCEHSGPGYRPGPIRSRQLPAARRWPP